MNIIISQMKKLVGTVVVFLVSILSSVNVSFPLSVVLEMSIMGSEAAALLCHPANTQIRARYQPDFSDDHLPLVP